MYNFLRNFLRRQLKKLKVWFRKSSKDYIEKPIDLKYSQLRALDIFREMIYNKKSKITFDANTQKLAIELNKIDSSHVIIIDETNFRVIDNMHAYDIEISHKLKEYMLKLYRNKRNKDFKKVFNETNANVEHSLDLILNKLKKND